MGEADEDFKEMDQLSSVSVFAELVNARDCLPHTISEFSALSDLDCNCQSGKEATYISSVSSFLLWLVSLKLEPVKRIFFLNSSLSITFKLIKTLPSSPCFYYIACVKCPSS